MATSEEKREYAKQWRKKHKDRLRDHCREKGLLYRYGLTLAAWNALFEGQGRRCAICKTDTTRRWDTDHDHVTGEVRGVLCETCNRGIGLLKDSADLLRAAADYLTK